MGDLFKRMRAATVSPTLPQGVPLYVDAAGLSRAGQTPGSPVTGSREDVSLGESIRRTLRPLGLTCEVRDGLAQVVALRRPAE